MAEPYFHPLLGGDSSEVISRHDRLEAAEIASREEMERDRALGTPRLAKHELPLVR